MSSNPTNALSAEQSELCAIFSRLDSIDPTSKQYSKMILLLTTHASKMETQTLQAFMCLVDRALSSGQMDPESVSICLGALQTNCSLTQFLPLSFLLSEGLAKDLGPPAVQGDSADVSQGTHSGVQVAIKRLRVSARNMSEVSKRFYNEVVIWKYLSHPNVVPFLGIAAPADNLPLCMVSPWLENGSVMKYLEFNPDTDRTMLLMNLCDALKYLHSLDVVHADLKGDNILINSSGRACITGFGLASIRKALEATSNDLMLSSRSPQTWRWAAPELLFPDTVSDSSRGPSKASDIYALAMISVEIFSGRLPFHELTGAAVAVRIAQEIRPGRPDHPQLSDGMWKLIEQCWHQDRAKRPSIYLVSNSLRSMMPKTPLLKRLVDIFRN